MTLENKVQEILDKTINPQLALHNGSATLTGIEDRVAKIKFLGACAGCVASSDTFETVIKANILGELPELKDVVVDDTVSDDLLEMARKILSGEMRDK